MTNSARITPLTMKRLAFIRLLHQQGNDQSLLAEPLAFTSVLSFHDTVEHFLVLAGEHLGATLPNHIQFMRYWDELHPGKLPGGVALSGKVAMDRLNRLRNGFKHAGSMPSLSAVEQARGDVASFLEDNTPKVFGVAYDGIDMADLITQEDARDLIKEADAAEASGDRPEAMALLVEAFQELISSLATPWGRSSAFAFGGGVNYPDLATTINSFLNVTSDIRQKLAQSSVSILAGQLDAVTKATTAMQEALRITTLGIEFHKYYRFDLLTPTVWYDFAGDVQRKFPRGYAPNREEYEYCQQFVITVSLRLADIKAHIADPSWENGKPPF
jgi:hypothetical protein